MSAENLRFWFVWSVLIAICIYKLAHAAYRRGRRSVLREHFSFTLPRDHSARERL